MSSRTAGSNRAVKAAWENELRLVLDGKGTRDWTEEQQRQIVERGKSYDDKGVAFEGQHMKSVSAYPQYQDDPRNIQFLSREEHLAAHGGNWKLQTNGYYDPVLKTMSTFGEGPPQPCAEILLTTPLYPGPLDASSTQTSRSERESVSDPAKPLKGRLRQWTESARHFAHLAVKDQRVRAVVGIAFATSAAVAADTRNRSISVHSNPTNAPPTPTSPRTAVGPSTGSLLGGRQSPEAHGVSGYTRKDGTNVRPYQRGGKRD